MSLFRRQSPPPAAAPPADAADEWLCEAVVYLAGEWDCSLPEAAERLAERLTDADAEPLRVHFGCEVAP